MHTPLVMRRLSIQGAKNTYQPRFIERTFAKNYGNITGYGALQLQGFAAVGLLRLQFLREELSTIPVYLTYNTLCNNNKQQTTPNNPTIAIVIAQTDVWIIGNS